MKNLWLILLFVLTACSLGSTGTFRPLNPPFMPGPPPNSPQAYQQGWNDGCETGMGAHGSDIYRSTYHFTQDPSQILDPMYYKAWQDAQNFCLTYILEYSYRGTYVHCMLDGITDDCGDTTEKSSVPFLGGSGDSFYGGIVSQGGGVGALIGGTDGSGFIGDTSGIGSALGSW